MCLNLRESSASIVISGIASGSWEACSPLEAEVEEAEDKSSAWTGLKDSLTGAFTMLSGVDVA
jgi:hypothetical protein